MKKLLKWAKPFILILLIICFLTIIVPVTYSYVPQFIKYVFDNILKIFMRYCMEKTKFEKNVEVNFMDDEADPEKVIEAYEELKVWGAHTLVGAVTSDACIALSAETEKDNLFQVTPSSSAVESINRYNAFQICFSDPNQGAAAARNRGLECAAGEYIAFCDSDDMVAPRWLEHLLDAAKALCEAMGVRAPNLEDYTLETLQKPFYGVYYGQAALPMEPDAMYHLTNEVLEGCTVKCHDNGQTAKVFDKTRLGSKDLYDVFLSGGAAVLEIRNPAGQPGKELIVFRDSFGSSMVPLLLNDYETVWVLDTRYVNPAMLGRFVEFKSQDVLFLYSTLILNSSSALRK